MIRILIVSPHFPPTNAADMQRVRLMLPYLREAGIDAEVLAVKPKDVAAPVDPWLLEGLPSGVPVHRAKVLGLRFSKIPGLGSLANRALGGLRKEGSHCIVKRSATGKPFDLVYFSTTQFGIHVLGPYWKRKFGVPFSMDFQDPWVNDFYKLNPQIYPPGGPLKYGVARAIAVRQERQVLSQCDGITSVSQKYVDTLKERYSFIGKNFPTRVLSFPADQGDVERAKRSQLHQSIFDPSDGFQHWVYVGRGGADMHFSVRALFESIEKKRNSGACFDRVKIHFIGTSYASKGQGVPSFLRIAEEFNLRALVEEVTDRIPFSETIRCIVDADALIVPGSTDAAYNASKIYPYLFADKPLLAIFNEQSPIVSKIKKVGGAELVTFNQTSKASEIAKVIANRWLNGYPKLRNLPFCARNLECDCASAHARILYTFFESCIRHSER